MKAIPLHYDYRIHDLVRVDLKSNNFSFTFQKDRKQLNLVQTPKYHIANTCVYCTVR